MASSKRDLSHIFLFPRHKHVGYDGLLCEDVLSTLEIGCEDGSVIELPGLFARIELEDMDTCVLEDGSGNVLCEGVLDTFLLETASFLLGEDR